MYSYEFLLYLLCKRVLTTKTQLMLKVEVKYNNIERALKMLRRKVRNTKQTLKLRQNQHFTKKSEIKREQIKLAAYKQKKYNEENY